MTILLLAGLVGLSGCVDDKVDTGDTDETGTNLDDADGDGVGVETDCDDEDASIGGPSVVYADADADGFGDPGVSDTACEVGAGTADNDLDCDDTNAAVNPDAAEVCDTANLDEDCDGATDDDDTSVTGQVAYYADSDLDGYGDDAGSLLSCDAPAGYVVAPGDCDDTSALFNPAADESDCADPNDYNCDGSTGFVDADGDGFSACQECDDTSADVNPGAEELCNGIDDNCDGDVDGGSTGTATWYTDADGDGFGDLATAVDSCEAPIGAVANGDDCDDTRAGVNPDALEICDAADTDEDCDGTIDDADASLSDAPTWFLDSDGDAYGVEGTTVASCDQPAGYVALVGDCDDADTAYNPGADESDCTDANDYNCDGSTGFDDADADGFAACEECNDASAATYPGADELCDSADNDCDAEIDEGALDAATWYADADEDGYGDGAMATMSCAAPTGYVADATDCDDGESLVHPGAIEICDVTNVDEDCDTLSDDADTGALGTATWYADTDGDGFGDNAVTTESCDGAAGYVADSDDCDDTRASINPDATEICDDADTDEDCDGLSDDLDPDSTGGGTWYVDADGDGFGDSADLGVESCGAPAGYVADHTDCDDADDSVTTERTWYSDLDGDGFGDPAVMVSACDAPALTVADATDCDDTRAAVNPAAVEVCDALDMDEDCDALSDDEDASVSDAPTWYADVDGDAYGETDSTMAACDQPEGYTALPGDCNDADTAYNPGAVEDDCDDANDYNCDGSVAYTDGDGDGFAACADCDDSRADINVDADEVCDDADNDCDGTVDEAGALDAGTWYADMDADGYGDLTTATGSCDAPSGYVGNGTDCDDASSLVHPGATEVCDDTNTDEDCDALADDADGSVVGQATRYADVDGDGYGASSDSGTLTCETPADTVLTHDDCNDAVAAVNPGATEVCDAANVDEDCDGASDDADTGAGGETLWYVDNDGDGFGDADGAGLAACDLPAGYVSNNTDCDDASAAISPAATEMCDAGDVDEDCDGASDDADTTATGKSPFYADADGDTYGSGAVMFYCDAPSGAVTTATDCDDSLSSVNPGATEVCDAANTDEDCDGAADDADASATGEGTWYADADGDGYGSTLSPAFSYCDAAEGFVATRDDCDDTVSTVNPGAVEICDALNTDEDCDGSADDADTAAAFKTRYYDDADADTYGAASDAGTLYCDAVAGLTTNHTDCDDGMSDVNPAAVETCNEIDDNCDGSVDNAAVDAGTFYADADGDGFGDMDESAMACSQPDGFVADDTDCDDTTDAVNPDAIESCNGEDDDCDGTVDEDATDFVTWYADMDVDGYGDAGMSEFTCEMPEGYVADDTDCDDAAAAINPGAAEICDAANVDEDCDGAADDADTAAAFKSRYYPDADTDGYGDAADAGALYCDAPAMGVMDHTDCDDAAAAVHPGAAEVCNETDDDCDGAVDEDAVDRSTFYADSDMDSYGDAAEPALACSLEAGFSADATDCDDTVATTYPGAPDTCNGEDDDCDGAIDEDGIYGTPWFADMDGDGYGVMTEITVVACAAPEGYSGTFGDCDDAAAAVNPGAAEVCDAADTDEDCDGLTDDADASVTGQSSWYPDADGDGYGVSDGAVMRCDEPGGYGADATDCDDDSAAVYPGAEEVCDDGVVNDCDAATDGSECLFDGQSSASTADITLTGLVGADAFGTSMAGADVNGDGIGDLAISAYGYDRGATANAGGTWIFLGPLDGTETLATADATIQGNLAGDRLGFSIANLGDSDADGFDELLLGADGWNSPTTDAGGAFIFDHASTGTILVASAVATISGDTTLDFTGTDVAGPGDVSGDGIPDAVIGAFGRDTAGSSAGTVGLFSGPVSGTMSFTTADVLIQGGAAGDNLGWSVDAAGDIDGDGTNEFIAGAYGADPASMSLAGAAYIFGGISISGSAESEHYTKITGSTAGDELGYAVAGAGDVNDDGYDDVLLGAHKYDVGALADAGAAYLFLGSAEWIPSGDASTADAIFTGSSTTDMLGHNLGAGGDVNQDGYTDLLLGAGGWDAATGASNAGAMFLIYGPVTGTVAMGSYGAAGGENATFYGIAASDGLGGVVTTGNASAKTLDIVPDLDNDGYDDIVGGARSVDNGATTNVGAAYIWFGGGI
ncbi:MAG: MopE-related protein [Myxococcota bacterium]